MSELAILIPTLGRPDRLQKVVDNIKKTTKGGVNIYFIVEQHDQLTINAINEIKNRNVFLIHNQPPYTYVSAINTGFASVKEEFVFCGSDDLEFTLNWDVDVLKQLKKFGFVGVKDSWTITKTGKHASHFAVRRDYIEKEGGAEGYPGYIYNPNYQHFMCDIETEQTAQKRGEFVVADSTVEHNHWFTKTAELDKTYSEAQPLLKADMQVFNKRRHKFEQYLFEDLFAGKVTPIPQKPLSIVIASYNAASHLIATIQSYQLNTYQQNYEMVIIDDVSDEKTKRTIMDFARKDNRIKPVFLKEKHYTNRVWNLAGKYSKNEVIVISNNDVEVTKNWDIHLMNAATDNVVASPYQTDNQLRIPYGKHQRTGNLDIRGTLFALNRETYNKIFPIPSDLLMWFGDNYIAKKAKEIGECVWVEKAGVHHAGSRSSIELNKQQDILNWIIRGDAYAYALLTGEDVWHWIDVTQKRLGL
jgi:glycosyltransferase involved in cell wall biosynthesis